MRNFIARLPIHHMRNSHLLSLSILLCLLLAGCGTTAFAQTVPANAGLHFTTQARLGFQSGDDWEPSITSDRYGHIYAMFKHYNVTGRQTCWGCGLHMVFQRSDDGGQTWSLPRAIAPGPFTGNSG